jgi:hypothetical protein
METVLLRRKDYCGNNSPISKLKGVNDVNNEVIDNINRQSKVKESKVQESIINKSIVKESEVNNIAISTGNVFLNKLDRQENLAEELNNFFKDI